MKKKFEINGFGLAVMIIVLSLAAGVVIVLSPPSIEVWTLSLLSLLVVIVAGIKFTALSLFSFRRGERILGCLCGFLALGFLMLLAVDIQYIIDLQK
jgi:hypothetical protein